MKEEVKDDDWIRYKELVLSDLSRLHDDREVIRQEIKDGFADQKEAIDNLSKEVTTLKTKAKIWGSLAGAIISFAIAFLNEWFVFKK